MDEEESTPRSGRRKKSTLAKLAASKGRKRDEPDFVHGRSASEDLKYPIDANVEIQNDMSNGRPDDSDEELDGGIKSGEAKWRGRAPSDGTIDQFQSLQVQNNEEDGTTINSDESDMEISSEHYNVQEKGEKRHWEINSSAEEVNRGSTRNKHRKPPVGASRGSDDDHSSMDSKNKVERQYDQPQPSTSGFSPRHSNRHNRGHVNNENGDDFETGELVHLHEERVGLTPPGEDTGSFDSENSGDFEKGQGQMANDFHDSFGTQQGLAVRYKEILSQQDGFVGNSFDANEADEMKDGISSLKKGDIYHSHPSPVRLNSTSSSASSQSSFPQPPERPWSAVPQSSTQFDMMSQRSYQSTSVLPLITTKEARKRSFLVGSLNHNSSLLGAEELDRFFPDRKLRLFVGTWNMCEMKKLPESMDDFLLSETLDYIPDMYVIGTQESHSNRREWDITLQETIGPQHVLFHSAGHGVLYLSVFLRRDLIWFCSVSEEAFVSTRPGPTGVKTKGGIAVSFTFFGTSFLFISSHLSPHDGKLKERAADYHKIATGINLPKQVVTNQYIAQQADATARFDCVFWCGDLNFRLEKERDRIDKAMDGINAQDIPSYEDLVRHDELFRARNEGLAFQEFQEGRIKFRPTYKYDTGSDDYDTSKKMRIPGYTDRVLFRCKKKHTISCLYYDSVQSMKESDHRPVFSLYEVAIRPGRDTVPLAAGMFERDIWLEANKRRAMRQNMPLRDGKSSTVCMLQ